jgi:hypothetical protein
LFLFFFYRRLGGQGIRTSSNSHICTFLTVLVKLSPIGNTAKFSFAHLGMSYLQGSTRITPNFAGKWERREEIFENQNLPSYHLPG